MRDEWMPAREGKGDSDGMADGLLGSASLDQRSQALRFGLVSCWVPAQASRRPEPDMTDSSCWLPRYLR